MGVQTIPSVSALASVLEEGCHVHMRVPLCFGIDGYLPYPRPRSRSNSAAAFFSPLKLGGISLPTASSLLLF